LCRRAPSPNKIWRFCFISSSPSTFGEREEFNRVSSLRVTADTIRVNVSEGIFTENPVLVIYELDYNLRAVNASLSGELVGRFMEMQGDGKLPKESPIATAERLISQVRVIKGGRGS
jgi:hypothetical protein